MPVETWNTILSFLLLSVAGSVAWLWRLTIDNANKIGAIDSALDLPQLKRDIDVVHSRITRLDKDVSRLEGKVRAVDIPDISKSVNKVSGQIESLERQVSMLNQHLLDKR